MSNEKFLGFILGIVAIVAIIAAAALGVVPSFSLSLGGSHGARFESGGAPKIAPPHPEERTGSIPRAKSEFAPR